MKKRILSLVIAVALCFGLVTVVPLTASAADTYTSVVNGRDDGVWLFPLASGSGSFSDWAGCSNKKSWSNNGCIFCSENHYTNLWSGDHNADGLLGHRGFDVTANEGTPVYAAAPGIVRAVSEDSDRGKYVIIEHVLDDKLSYYSVYQHLSKTAISNGTTIKENGKIKIGEVGHTGNSKGNHLHFEIYIAAKGYSVTVNGIYNAGSGWLTKTGNSQGYILTNPSKKSYDDNAFVKGIGWADVGQPRNSVTAHSGSVTYTFDINKVTIGKTTTSQFFLAKPESGKTTIPVRQENNSNGKELYTIDKDVPVLVIDSAVNSSGNTWYKTPDGGWIYSERLTAVNVSTFKTYTTKNMFIVKDGAPIRYSPYQESNKVSTVKYADKISVIGEFTNARNNKWYMDAQGHWIFSGNISEASPVTGQWLLHNGGNNDVYLNASDDKDGGNVTVKSRDKSAWQTFKISASNSGYSIAVTGSKSGRVVNVYTEGTSAAGQKITLWSVTNDVTQLWTFEYKDKAFLIHPSDNSKVALTAYSDGSVKLAANSGAKEQLWILETPGTAAVAPVSYAPEYDEGENAPPIPDVTIPEETPAPAVPTTPTTPDTPSGGADFTGVIPDGNSDIWFDYEVKQDGYYTYSYTADNWEVSGLFYSLDGKTEIWFIQEHPQETLAYNELTKQYEATGGVYLHNGNYKFRFVPYSWYVGTGPQNTKVSLSISRSSVKYGIDSEPNDTSANAMSLPANGTQGGYLGGYRNVGLKDVRDWLTFTVPGAGDYTLQLLSDQSCFAPVVIYDKNGQHIDTKFPKWSDFTNAYEINEPITLPSAGQYYVEIKLDDERAGNGNYKLTINGASYVSAVPKLDSAASWAHEGITSAIGKGFVPSDLQNSYANTITRQEFCRMAVKWLEYKTGQSIDAILTEQGKSRNTYAFTDTTDPDILAAYALGITNGTTAPTADKPGTFTPNGNFTREQAATMIRNTCKAAGMDVSSISNAGFTDIGTASSWAVDGINFVRNAGIMGGTSTTSLVFSPKGIYSRQESIVTFNRIP